jgi:hypothetical protein
MFKVDQMDFSGTRSRKPMEAMKALTEAEGVFAHMRHLSME